MKKVVYIYFKYVRDKFFKILYLVKILFFNEKY